MKTRTSTTPQTIEARKERWKAFMADDAGPGFLFHVDYRDPEADLLPCPHKWPEKASQRIEWAWSTYCYQMEQAEWLDDDRVPNLNNLTGTEIFAEALGCRVARPEHTLPFAIACVNDANEAQRIAVPELSSSSLAYLFDIADELQRRAGPGAAQRLVDNQSPMDVASLVWAKEDLFVAMLEAPGAVKELAAKARELMIAFFDEWFQRYGTEYVAHHPAYFMSGGITLSEDEVGTVSAEMFETFFLPELSAISEHYGGIGIHCCANAKHQWAGFRNVPGLRLLNFGFHPTANPDPDYVKDAYPFFADRCVQMHTGWHPDGPAVAWPDVLPRNCRIVYQVRAGSREEAMRLCEQLQQKRVDLYGG